MAPPKRQHSESPPASPPQRRKSARLAAQAEAHAASSTQQQLRGISVLSTNTESSETWPAVEEAAKERITQYQPQNRAHEDKLQTSLNAFIEWLPEGGRDSIARDIINAVTDEDLHKVFHNLLTGLAAPMKARSKTSSVTDSPHAKRQENVDIVASTIIQPEARDSDFHHMCLRRDAHRCVITGSLDMEHWKKLGCPEEVNNWRLEAAHIIPFAYGSWDKSSEPPNEISSAWEVLWRCFPKVRQTGMQIENINDLSNGISLRNYLHTEFGCFTLAFKPTDNNNVYEVKVFKTFPKEARTSLPENGYVEFTRAEDAQDLALPNAALLDTHYRLAEILNASGMAEVIDRYLRDWENIKGSAGGSLREDGGTDIGQFLRVALWEHVVG